MPKITNRVSLGGAMERVTRLGLASSWAELESILIGFELLVEERRNSNSAAEIQSILDDRFCKALAWTTKNSGGVTWAKCVAINGASVCLEVSRLRSRGRNDLLLVDVVCLCDELTAGRIDVGVIVVPSDQLAVFLTDGVACFSDAVKAVEQARAQDFPLVILGLEHDGPGISLKKGRTG